MIRIVAGGKKHSAWCQVACQEYEKRLKKPYQIEWRFMDEQRFNYFLTDWPFSHDQLVICCDERGEILSSVELSQKLEKSFVDGKEVIILIGGAFGFTDEVRQKADVLWSFSKLVFPHMIARLIVAEQIYRSQEITQGRPYHHE